MSSPKDKNFRDNGVIYGNWWLRSYFHKDWPMVPIKKSAITKIARGTKKSVGSEKKKDTLVVIKERCIEIDTLLKGSLALDKKKIDAMRKKREASC